jgi:hypothetical protein
MSLLIKRVLENSKSGTKYVVIPKSSEIKKGDYVKISIVKEDNGDTGTKQK